MDVDNDGLNDGDEMLLSGTLRGDKLFIALAHRNLTRKVEGHEGWATRLLVTILVVTCALWLGALMGGDYGTVFGLVFLALGFAMASTDPQFPAQSATSTTTR